LVAREKGAILIVSMIFLTVLSILGFALADMLVAQNRLSEVKIAQEYAFQIAESGLNFARWRLAHDEANYASATQTLFDPTGGPIGTYQLEFTPPGAGSTVVEIRSTGWYQNKINYTRTLEARYGRKAFTFYSFLFDSPVWFGGDAVDGRAHSNEGLRMDSTGNSEVTSRRATYTCTAIHACNPSATRPGVWGVGGNQNLWDFPTSNVDFAYVTSNLNDLQYKAVTEGVGLFLPSAGAPNGYDLNFLADGNVEIYQVTALNYNLTRGRWEGPVWKTYSNPLDISGETQIALYTLEPNDLIFAETNLWVRGEVNGRVTVVAANLPDVAATNRDIMLGSNNSEIRYSNYDGSCVLGLIAQRNILITYFVLNNMRLDAVLMAQKGLIGRDYYSSGARRIRNSITTYGSMISKDFSDPEFRWVNGAGATVSGFNTNVTTYDHHLVYYPPPYFPVMGDYDFISWEEKEKGQL